MMRNPEVMIFDMDGTLTLPAIDFDRIRAELGIASGTILEALESMSADRRRRAYAVIEEHERIAAAESELQEGVHAVWDFLQARDIRTAIATRNSRQSVQTVLDKHGLSVDRVHTRDDGVVKPSPQPVLSICEFFKVDPAASWIVGDYIYDIQSGNDAGATTVLLIADGDRPQYSDLADHVIHSLSQLMTLLSNGASQ